MKKMWKILFKGALRPLRRELHALSKQPMVYLEHDAIPRPVFVEVNGRRVRYTGP